MNRYRYLTHALCLLAAVGISVAGGCRGHQYGHIVREDAPDMVGSHTAGAATFNPLIDDAVAQLLGRQIEGLHQVSHMAEGMPAPKRICFVGVENKSIEEIGDFKEQIYQQIDTRIVQSDMFMPVSKRFVDAGLREARLRPDSLFIPVNMRTFTGVMEQMGQPFDYLLYATITSGTTGNNSSYQRDYVLTMELVNTHTGHYDKQSAKLSKGYHRSKLGALK
ncbi:MAG: penicillin-binding protein activator LpoB, partial [Pirellulaceae bacterium]